MPTSVSGFRVRAFGAPGNDGSGRLRRAAHGLAAVRRRDRRAVGRVLLTGNLAENQKGRQTEGGRRSPQKHSSERGDPVNESSEPFRNKRHKPLQLTLWDRLLSFVQFV